MKKILLLFYLFSTHFLIAQNRIVSGKVISQEDQNPIAGVTVSADNGTTGTATDTSGFYSLAIGADVKRLTFNTLGFHSQTIEIGVSNDINVNLKPESSELNEVVVTANAIEKEKRSLGYSIQTIGSKELVQGRDRSFLNALQGKVPGALIQSASGSPGSSTRIVLRGGTSLLNNNQALFVVDGIPIDNTQAGTGDNLNNQVDAGNRGNDINPEDVETVTVLKGPAAAALYGSRAANGALLITTKSGKGIITKKAQLIYSTSYTFESILKFPDFQNEYGQGGKKQPDLRENFSWGPKFDGVVRPWGRIVDGKQRIKPYGPLPNNVKDFFETGHTYTNNVSLTGGGSKASYYASLGNVKQNGVIPNTGYDRTSIRLSGTSQVTERIFSSASVNYIRSQGSLSVQGQRNSFYDELIQTPRDIPIRELRDYKATFNDLNTYYSPYTINPYWHVNENTFKTTIDRVLGNLQLGYKLNPWLIALYRIGTDVYSDRRTQVLSIRRVTDTENSQFSTPYVGKYELTNINVREFTSDLMLNGKKALTKSLGLTFTIGQNIRQRNYNSLVGTANSLVTPDFYNFSNLNGTPAISDYQSIRRLMGIYADVTLSYKNYLFLEVTGRNDWSSTLPKNNNSFFYPGMNASFLFSEAFNLTSNNFTYGKLRGGLAQVGNDADPYLLSTTYEKASISDGFDNTDLRFPINNVPSFTRRRVQGNNSISPEITTSFEIGTDVYFFQDRIGIEATYYRQVSTKQILQLPTPPSSGYSSKVLNAGILTNNGIELMLKTTPILLHNSFRWDVSFNYTKNKSLVKELPEGLEQVVIGSGLNGAALVAQRGQPYGSFYAETEMRDPQGRIVVDKETGLPRLDPKSKIVGNIQPRFYGGIYNTFSFKGASLNVLFDIRKGGQFYSRTKDLMEFVGTSKNTLLNDREPFVIPNSVVLDEGSNTYRPNTTKVDAQEYWTDQTVDSRNILDASFIKLREVSLSYSFPKKLMEKTPVGNLSIGFFGRNLYIWTPAENAFVDPEISSLGGAPPTAAGGSTPNSSQNNTQGYDYGALPSLKSYGFNLRVTF